MIRRSSWLVLGWLVGCGTASVPTASTATDARELASAESLTARESDDSHAATGAGIRRRGLRETSDPPDSLGAAPLAGRIHVMVQVEARSEGRRFTLHEGDTLRTGDGVVFFLSVDRAAYLYLAQVSASGATTLLYPRRGDSLQVQSGELVRLPRSGRIMELDDEVGDERLVVIASAQPLRETDPEFDAAIAEVAPAAIPETAGAPALAAVPDRGQPAAPATSPSPAPPARGLQRRARAQLAASGFRMRGVTEQVDGDGGSLLAEADESGVAAFRFSFHHVAR